MNPEIFREYDIRGVADTDLTDEVVYDIGRAIGTIARRRRIQSMAVGQDARSSSNRIADLLIAGLVSTGLEVHDIGTVPTPVLYFSCSYLGHGGGIEVTGSHNPGHYNGMKIVLGQGTIHGDEIQEVRRVAEAGEFVTGYGTLYSTPCVDPYIDWIVENITLGPHKPKVVVDAGNGVAGSIMMRVLGRMGIDALGYNIQPDGSFPEHAPDPTTVAVGRYIAGLVEQTGADLGLGLDGDGDRLGVVDHTGEIQWGDRLMVLFARDVLAHTPGATIVSEVKCSQTLYDDIEARGGKAIMSPVGHSLIKQTMRDTGAALAGEMSGHFFFSDRYFGYDDAIYAAARLIELLSKTPDTLPGLLSDLPESYATPELRLPCRDDHKFEVVKTIANQLKRGEVIDIDGVRVVYEDGWGLVRASNTQPVISLRAEAQSAERRDAIRDRLIALVEAAT